LFGISYPWFMGRDHETVCRRLNRELSFSCSELLDNPKSTIAAIDRHIPVPTGPRFRSKDCCFRFRRCANECGSVHPISHPRAQIGDCYPTERHSDEALLDRICHLRQRRRPRPRRQAFSNELLLTRRRFGGGRFPPISAFRDVRLWTRQRIKCTIAPAPKADIGRRFLHGRFGQ